MNNNGLLEHYKSLLVEKYCVNNSSIDFNEILSPFVNLIIFRVLLSVVAVGDLELEKLDVKMPSLHGDLEEEIYMD